MFENASSVVVNDKASLILEDLGVALKDTRITTHDEANANYVEFDESGLYRVDFSSDVNGNYTYRLVEFMHETEDGAQTTLRCLNLSESGTDSETLTFNQLDKVRIKATIDEDGKE